MTELELKLLTVEPLGVRFSLNLSYFACNICTFVVTVIKAGLLLILNKYTVCGIIYSSFTNSDSLKVG